jgi:hypothetical protein
VRDYLPVMGKLTSIVGAALARAAPAQDPRRNAINVIAPYLHHGMWVFDDARVGLRQEPFVSGADDWITRVTADIPDAERGFTMVFSGRPFPGAQYRMERRRLDMGGAWYWSPQLEMEGWLCSALFRYFDAAPDELHVQVKPGRV